MISFIKEKVRNISVISENRLTKILSFAVAALIGIGSANLDVLAKSVKTQKSSNEASSHSNNIVRSTKNNKKKVVAGGIGLSAIAVLIKAIFTSEWECSPVITGADFFNGRELTGDEYFRRLGGTQREIDRYISLKESYTADKYSICICREDAHRIIHSYFFAANELKYINWSKGDEGDIPEKFFTRILEIHAVEDDVDYTQGEDRFLVLAMLKFLRTEIKDCSPETEAKIYYVYKTLSKTVSDYSKQLLDGNSNFGAGMVSKYLSSDVLEFCKRSQTTPSALWAPVFVRPVNSGMMDVLRYDQFVKFWDKVVSYENILKNGKFNSEYALSVEIAETARLVEKKCRDYMSKKIRNYMPLEVFLAQEFSGSPGFCLA